jgi:aminoglycoside phosphotransferase family enzyme
MAEYTEDMIDSLKRPDAYDEKADEIRMIQTHVSWVFLTGGFAYKIKKPVDFGFLDFTTLEKRKRFCKREIEINRMFSPELYLGILPVNKHYETIKINGKGETIDYVIKMKELPQENLMDSLLDGNKIGTDVIESIVKILVNFYSRTDTYRLPNSVGSLDTVKFNWKENFTQTEPFIGKTIDQKNFDMIKSKVSHFMDNNSALFAKRLKEGHVKWCHGDLHSGNIFVVGNKVYIFDAIEFNERFACSDVASDIAFLSMDLDFRHRKFLSDIFVRKYIEKSGDDITKILDFYKCYRAFVRGKVVGFRMNDPNMLDFEKNDARNLAKLYFQLAAEYAKNF